METQTETAGIGEWQSKLASTLKVNEKIILDAFLFARKRRDIFTQPLAKAYRAMVALREGTRLTIHCMQSHGDREDYAKQVLEKLSE